ncbi:hypothetical protein HOV93_32740 [Planctomycetes bacterium FF15]|uniref:Uncharacterized protein n=1 Tax=Bremerella alba TaxID=980252 RepID=A0A7V8V733_9BACT|nr:hypothetical protein [Bremerella alba]
MEQVTDRTIESQRAELAGLVGKLLAQVWLKRKGAQKTNRRKRGQCDQGNSKTS